MKNLNNYIAELLYTHDCVVIPGLGGFVANYIPAKIHPVLHTFSPPSKAILFNVRLQSNDGVLATYVSEKENIPYAEAIRRINIYVSDISLHFTASLPVEITKVGTLYKDAESNLQFEPSKDINYLLQSFGLNEFVSPAIRRGTYDINQKKRFNDRTVVRYDRRIPVAVKKAVWIGLPVAALLVAGFLSISPLKKLYTQYSDVVPALFNAKDKNIETKAETINNGKIFEGLLEKDNSAGKNGNAAVMQSFRISETVVPAAESTSADAMKANHKFYIIGGCFMIKENAERFVAGMKEKGFSNAGIFMPEHSKLYHVYFSAFDDKQSALDELGRIKGASAAEAWFLAL
jgi:hypothetical protein